MSVEMFVDVATDVSNGKFPWFRLTVSLVTAILVLKFVISGGVVASFLPSDALSSYIEINDISTFHQHKALQSRTKQHTTSFPASSL